MNVATLKLLTWATVATAVVSALLLAAFGPDMPERGALGVKAASVALARDAGPRAAAVASLAAPRAR